MSLSILNKSNLLTWLAQTCTELIKLKSILLLSSLAFEIEFELVLSLIIRLVSSFEIAVFIFEFEEEDDDEDDEKDDSEEELGDDEELVILLFKSKFKLDSLMLLFEIIDVLIALNLSFSFFSLASAFDDTESACLAWLVLVFKLMFWVSVKSFDDELIVIVIETEAEEDDGIDVDELVLFVDDDDDEDRGGVLVKLIRFVIIYIYLFINKYI